MDFTSVSEYDNVTAIKSSFSDSVMYQAVDNVMQIAGSAFSKLFCPFCVSHFELKFSLMDHLRNSHNSFLMQAYNKCLPFEQCPFCDAKFHGKHLTTKHALFNHSRVITELYMDRRDKSSYFKCLFCLTKFKRRSYLKFSHHIEEEHFLSFLEVFQRQFLTESCSEASFQSDQTLHNSDCDTDHEKEKNNSPCIFNIKDNKFHHNENDFVNSSNVNCFDLADLKLQLDNMKSPERNSTASKKISRKSILKSSRPASLTLQNAMNLSKSSVRRVLRFDLPESSLESNKENSVLSQNINSSSGITFDEHSLLCKTSNSPEQNHSLVSEKSDAWSEPKFSSTPNNLVLDSSDEFVEKSNKRTKKCHSYKNSSFKSYINIKTKHNFQCGKCKQLFNENNDLVQHIKRNHNKFTSNLLQPCYQCAICNAKFFKNNYLKKHYKLHANRYLKKSVFY